jgi:hypothetical protein
MIYINLVSGLAIQNPALDKEVYVYGYSALGDGGGGYFIWKATAELPAGASANNGIWFTGPVGTGLWERQFTEEAINIRWFNAKGTAGVNDATAIQNTVDFASNFGYNVFIPKGTFSTNSKILLKSNIAIYGEGELSVLQYFADTTVDHIFFVDTQNGSIANNIQNVRIFDIKFYSPYLFSSGKHFISLNGVSNFVIERCLFLQSRGDAIYIGAGVTPNSHITHNENITIRDCRFDGVAKTNRNAISILDCNHIVIENNYFINYTNAGMPGAIDIEPNPPVSGSSNEILNDIVISSNFFSNIGGASCCNVKLPPNAFAVNPSGIYFLNNYLDNVPSGFTFIYDYIPVGGIDVKVKIPLFIENNIIKNASNNGFALYSACQAKVSGNYINSAYHCLIGNNIISQTSCDINVSDNYFDKCGSTFGNGLVLYNCKRVELNFNTFNDCGTGTAGASNAIGFNSGSSDFIMLTQNIFLAPTGKTLIAIVKEAAHTFTNTRNNRFSNNQLNGLVSTFQYINDNNFGLATGITPAASVTIAHNLGSVPKWATVQPQSSNVPGIKNVTVDSTNITVVFTATPVGTVSLWWSVQA